MLKRTHPGAEGCDFPETVQWIMHGGDTLTDASWTLCDDVPFGARGEPPVLNGNIFIPRACMMTLWMAPIWDTATKFSFKVVHLVKPDAPADVTGLTDLAQDDGEVTFTTPTSKALKLGMDGGILHVTGAGVSGDSLEGLYFIKSVANIGGTVTGTLDRTFTNSADVTDGPGSLLFESEECALATVNSVTTVWPTHIYELSSTGTADGELRHWSFPCPGSSVCRVYVLSDTTNKGECAVGYTLMPDGSQ